MKASVLITIIMAPQIVIAAPAPAPVVVTIKPSAVVNADTFTLADIAEIKAPASTVAALGAAAIGRSPLEGVSRTITLGDVCLKLRQAGFDPAIIKFAGSDTITLTLAPAPPVPATADGSQATTTGTTVPRNTAYASSFAPAASNPTIVPAKSNVAKAGDAVSVQYIDGPVSLTVQGQLVSAASVGDMVTVRTTFSQKTLRGVLVDSQTVRL